jgi:hypothetical protein
MTNSIYLSRGGVARAERRSGAEEGRREGRRRDEGKEKKREKKERKKERKKREEMGERKEKKKGKRREQEGKEREGGVASAPIAAATAVGRPRACVLRALRETKRIAPALIAEKRSRVVVGRRAVRDGTAVKFGVVQKGLGLGF